jgi:L-fuculose-phosphate aldolase
LLRRELEIHHPAHRAILGKRAALVNYAPSGTSWLASKLRKALKPEINAYLMRNHGIVCCGPTLAETVVRAKALESACSHFFREAISCRIALGHEFTSPEVLTLLIRSEDMEIV